jgi:hypothetical protein
MTQRFSRYTLQLRKQVPSLYQQTVPTVSILLKGRVKRRNKQREKETFVKLNCILTLILFVRCLGLVSRRYMWKSKDAIDSSR